MCFTFSNNPSTLDTKTSPFDTVLTSENIALLTAVCTDQQEISNFTIGLRADKDSNSISMLVERIQIPCSMSKY